MAAPLREAPIRASAAPGWQVDVGGHVARDPQNSTAASLDEGGEGEGAEEENEPVTVGHGKVATLHHHQSTVRLPPLASPR